VTPLTRLADRWQAVPRAASLVAALLLLIGLGVIYQSEQGYRAQKADEVRVQAEILAASVTAALDFGDTAAAQEAADALRANPQLSAAGVYDADGRLFAGYHRPSEPLPQRLPRSIGHADNLLHATVPVVRTNERIGSVFLSAQVDPLSRRLARYGLIALLVFMASLVVTVLGVAHAALRRANRELTDANAELHTQMVERANAEEQLRQAQKMQALGQLTGGIAHDFNNLLTVIQGSADILKRPALEEDKRLRFADAIVQTASRAAALTGQLLAFARRQPLRPKVIDLNERIEAMTDLLERTLGARFVVRTELAGHVCPVEVDPTQLEVAVLNVAVNARDAMPEGGGIVIRTRDVLEGEIEGLGRSVALSVTDTGIGIGPDALARVFEPFFTTKNVGKGTGLGLSQVYGFAKQSGGDVRIDSEVGVGTTVTMLLPWTDKPFEAVATASRRTQSGIKGRVLLVEDNEEVGAFAESLLAELGHVVVRARSGEEGLQTIEGGAAFDVMFTDIVMPGISGIELAKAVQRRQPALPIVLTTGYSEEIARVGAPNLPVLLKPYRLDTLARALDDAMARRGSRTFA
jgi:signal transduction histidine kinase/ActR/RegA family two-component response regulator